MINLAKELKSLDRELEELVSFGEYGGFGGQDAVDQHQRKIDLLKHKQLLAVEKSNSTMFKVNVVIALVNITVFIYQVFFANST